MKTNKSTNQGYKIVEKTDRGYAGRFNSPYCEPMGKSLSLRFPESLDEFLYMSCKLLTLDDVLHEGHNLLSKLNVMVSDEGIFISHSILNAFDE